VAKDVEVSIDVPPGVEEGDRLRLSGEGEAGAAGGGRGDLFVRFRVLPDDRFERVGDDLYAWAEIPLTIAALGGKVSMPTLDGDDELDVPAGTQSGAVFRLKGRGVTRRSRRGRGELVVRAHVVTPERLSRKEKELLRELAALRGEEGKDVPSKIRRVLGSGS
jgi:molecular chaperone DnaJ